MQLLYCDESNLEEREGDFLLYGGISIEAGHALSLSRDMDAIRRRHGVARDFKLKFNPGPPEMTNAEFIALKQAVIEAAVASGARLLAYAVLHDLASNPDEARRFGINTVCYHFDCYLNRVDQPGLVLIDRFNDAGNRIEVHLAAKFSTGATGMPFGDIRLGRIIGFHYSAVGQSHLPSVIDIVLGSLRFMINAHTRAREDHQATAEVMAGLLAPLFHREDGQQAVSELGFLLSPKVVRAERYRRQYQSLKDFLGRGGIALSQAITGERC